ncbi:MAG: hypothetical protein KGY80_10330 [Candidatus Thorarchaeota archaeon]|nr:hypothetical protein [Candidatus Thorarchaeota archaeon]
MIRNFVPFLVAVRICIERSKQLRLVEIEIQPTFFFVNGGNYPHPVMYPCHCFALCSRGKVAPWILKVRYSVETVRVDNSTMSQVRTRLFFT